MPLNFTSIPSKNAPKRVIKAKGGILEKEAKSIAITGFVRDYFSHRVDETF
ncbi:MAG: hypothetical protein K0R71_580 [Bacillales bacterium]|jgi:hypothetical protein|nr:hypothetical protein [Bacillales bacterium]